MFRLIAFALSIPITVGLFQLFSEVIKSKEIEGSEPKKERVQIVEQPEKKEPEEVKSYTTGTPAVDRRVTVASIPKDNFRMSRAVNSVQVEMVNSFTKPAITFSQNSNSNILDSIGSGLGSPLQGISIGLKPLYRSEPKYPLKAKLLKKSGFVRAVLNIDSGGRVRSVDIIESQPEGLFDESAKDAMMRWRFNPKIENGVAVVQRALQRIEFNFGR